MQDTLVNLTYTVDVRSGERLKLPEALQNVITEGRWLITIHPYSSTVQQTLTRSHSVFLNSYVPEDEGLYDDNSTG